MIPILYSKTDNDYTKNGVGFLTDTISCDVTEERNGAFECVLTYPITGQHYADITEGAVIKAKPNDTSSPQLFRIYSHSKPINGIVSFAGEHISYDLNGIPITSLTLRSTTAQSAISAAISAGAFETDYTATSDISTLNSIDIKTPCSIRSALGGQEGSVLDVWGGEYEFDNKQIKLHAHRGSDTGVTIVYGKNLIDVRQERNITETYTHIMPYATYSEETEEGNETTQTDVVVTLTEKVIELSNAENVGHQKAIVIDLSEMFADDEEITETALRAKTNQYISAHPALGTPKISITASFVALWQTEEYKDIAPLERVRLCDTVTIKFDKLGISAKAKVVKTVYDALAERYKSVELGEARSNFADTVLAQNGAITELSKAVRKGFSIATQQMQKAIADATAAITGNSGGYVVLYPEEHPQEILILDAPTLDEAVHVWRWNSSGLGYSSTGYNGTYGLAMTMNGAIVADYITAGNLNGALITAGTVSSNAISAGFKNEIATSINAAKETVEQEFKVADEALMSRIATSTSKYNTAGKTIDFYGYGLNADSTETDTGEKASENNNKHFLNQTDGKLYISNGARWTLQETLPTITDNVCSYINQSADTIELSAGRLIYNGGKCTIEADGTLAATSGVFNNCSIIGGTFKVIASSSSQSVIELSYGDYMKNYITAQKIMLQDVSGPYTTDITTNDIRANGIIFESRASSTGNYFQTTYGLTSLTLSAIISGSYSASTITFQSVETTRYQLHGVGGVVIQASNFGSYGLTCNIGISEMPLRLCGTTVHTTSDINITTAERGVMLQGAYAFRLYQGEMALGVDTKNLRIWAKNVYFNCPAYANTGVIITSDARKKRCIEPIDNRYLDLIRRISPMRYKLADSDENIYHTGFIAQDVRKAMFDTDIAPDELGAFVDHDGVFALRYEEFIPLVLAYVKYLEGRIGILESKERFYNG